MRSRDAKTSTVEPVRHPLAVLVIGYGNTLRCDDGAGVRAAEAVGALRLEGVRVLISTQLSPEMAHDIRAVQRVVFLDARVGREGEAVKTSAVLSGGTFTNATHATNPEQILALVRLAYDARPEAFLLTIPGTDFSVGEALSSTARHGIVEAVSEVATLLGLEGRGPPR